MAVFLFEIIAILLFIRLADKSRLRELAPLIVTGIFVRFVYHLIVIDWLQLMKVPGSTSMRLWIPISAELTVWVTASYLYIQYMPRKHLGLYAACWIALMVAYMHALRLLHVIKFENGWNITYCAISIALFFVLLWQLWRWLRPQSNEQYQLAP